MNTGTGMEWAVSLPNGRRLVFGRRAEALAQGLQWHAAGHRHIGATVAWLFRRGWTDESVAQRLEAEINHTSTRHTY